MEREALKPVGGTRDAFEKWAKTFPNYIDITRFENGYSDSDTNYAWIAWQAALAQPAQEPVAWMHVQGDYEEPSWRQLDDDEIEMGWKQYPLYTAPPQRPWVGLTDEEIQPRLNGLPTQSIAVYARNIEAILKEKNT